MARAHSEIAAPILRAGHRHAMAMCCYLHQIPPALMARNFEAAMSAYYAQDCLKAMHRLFDDFLPFDWLSPHWARWDEGRCRGKTPEARQRYASVEIAVHTWRMRAHQHIHLYDFLSEEMYESFPFLNLFCLSDNRGKCPYETARVDLRRPAQDDFWKKAGPLWCDEPMCRCTMSPSLK